MGDYKMEEMTKRTELRDTNQTSSIVQRIVGIGFGIVQISLLFRLVFKWLGANPQNGFVQSLYAVTQLFVGFFEGIFSRVVTNGEQTSGYFEPATLIAMVVAAVISWAILALVEPRFRNLVQKTRYTN